MASANKKIHHTSNLFDQYLFFSFLSSLIMAGAFYLSDDFFFRNGILVSVLLVGNYVLLSRGIGQIGFFKRTFYSSALFLFQTFLLAAIAFSANSMGAIFLSLIPCIAGVQFFLHGNDYSKIVSQRRVGGLISLSICSYLILFGITDDTHFLQKDGPYMGLFAFWVLGVLFWGNRETQEKRLTFLKSFFKLKGPSAKGITVNGHEHSKDRLFFHDLINQTHGINLFLNYKVAGREGLDVEEVKQVVNEIKVIQSLIKNHFGFKHKNLVQTYEYVSFEFAKDGLERLVKSFLPEHLVKCSFVFSGRIASENDVQTKESCIVHYPSFYRIMTNLLKNISERRASKVELFFDYDEFGLHILTKNDVFSLRESGVNLAKKLESIILRERMGGDFRDINERGLGLESINSICEELHGEFHFSIEGDQWVSRVFLPLPHITSEKIEADLKKAA